MSGLQLRQTVKLQLREVGRNAAPYKDTSKYNAAYAEVNIASVPSRLNAVSGQTVVPNTVGVPTNRVFETYIVKGQDAALDTEVKILEEVAQYLQATPGSVYPSIQGTLTLYSQKIPCPSCTGVIEQFHKMYPNVKLAIGWLNEHQR